jgi:NitT/TauT family transport system substrate-binding protein
MEAEMENEIIVRFRGSRALIAGGAATASAEDALTLQLKWVTQAQFAGYYVAKDKGFYEEEGLDVTIKPGGPDINPAGDRRRRRRCDGRLDAVGASPRAKRACRWSTSPSRSRSSGMMLTCRKDSSSHARRFQGQDAGRLVRRQ